MATRAKTFHGVTVKAVAAFVMGSVLSPSLVLAQPCYRTVQEVREAQAQGGTHGHQMVELERIISAEKFKGSTSFLLRHYEVFSTIQAHSGGLVLDISLPEIEKGSVMPIEICVTPDGFVAIDILNPKNRLPFAAQDGRMTVNFKGRLIVFHPIVSR